MLWSLIQKYSYKWFHYCSMKCQGGLVYFFVCEGYTELNLCGHGILRTAERTEIPVQCAVTTTVGLH